jgi:hypothetical protein
MPPFTSIFRKIGFALVNIWLVFHLVAIATSPAPMPPASPLLLDAAMVALPYNQAMFLNHGYHYFAPDPGASTLISYRIDQPNDVPIKGRFPDTATFPRLRYHRYFMLAENVWGFPEQTQDEFMEAYGRHFSRQHNADTISLTILSHDPSSIARIRAGGQLSDPETFQEEPFDSYDFRYGETISTLKPVIQSTELHPEPMDSQPASAATEGNTLQPIPMTD